MKKLIFTAMLLPFAYAGQAQDFVDNALLFSRTQPGGSARVQAIGGAQVSLGGDYSAALSNPAGLGMYNRSEVTFSLGLNNNQTSSTYFNDKTDDGRTAFNIPGFSYVQKQNYSKDKFLGGAFAIAFNRTNNLNSRFSYEGDNSQSSIIDYFIDYANNNGRTPNDFNKDDFYTPAGLAYHNFLIQDYEDNNGMFWDSEVYPIDGDGNIDYPTVNQREAVVRRGNQSQLSFSYGGNYDDVLFFGATLGVATIRYKQDQVFTESDFRYQNATDFNAISNLSLDEEFDIQGSGVNLTVGTIVRPVDFLQLGLSVVTPTYYSVTDSYTARLSSDWNDFDYDGDGDPDLSDEYAEFDAPVISEYDLVTPGKLTVGASFISKYGFISGDFELVNYGNAKYTSNITGESYSPENADVKSAYEKGRNFRVGAEFRYEILRARAGFNHLSDPYRTENNIDRKTQSYSGGLGLRTSKFFVDIAVVYSQTNRLRSPYSAIGLPTPIATQKVTNTNFIVTAGFPF